MNLTPPNPERLLSWLEGRLPSDEAVLVANYVAQLEAGTTAERVAVEDKETLIWLRRFVSLSRKTKLHPIPPGLRQQLMSHFHAHRRKQFTPGLLRKLIATLSFDSQVGSPLREFRAAASGHAAGDPRQTIFSSEIADIVISTLPSTSGKLDVIGQILPEDASTQPDWCVQVLHNQVEIRMIQANAIGMFTIEAIPPGTYQFVLMTQQFEIETSLVTLKL
jgi:hypothetical protein